MYKFLERRFPSITRFTKNFVLGVKDLAKDGGLYINIKAKVRTSEHGILTLNRKEMELYYRLPKEVARVAPTVLISALPFCNYVMIPIAFYFPKKLLCSHFWTEEQRAEFPAEVLRERLKYYMPLFKLLQSDLSKITDDRRKELFHNALYKLGSGSHPTIDEIRELEVLFVARPFGLSHLQGDHAKLLCHMNGIPSRWLFRRGRLLDTAKMIRNLDKVTQEEGLKELKTDELKLACFLRGLNASNATEEEMMKYMSDWLEISTKLYPTSPSLVLHLPLFLGYNDTNRALLEK